MTTTDSVLLLAGSGDEPLAASYARRVLGARLERSALMRTALEAARQHHVEAVHVVNATLDLSLTQLGEFATALRSYGVELAVLDLPELSPESATRKSVLDLLVRVRLRDRKRHRGAPRLRPPSRVRASPAVGRPRRPVDVAAALHLLETGETVESAARLLEVPRSTLQRRLVEVGWVRGAVG